MAKRNSIVAPLILTAVAGSASAATIFVDESVTSSGVGSSFAEAFKTLEEALVRARSTFDEDDIILVAAGTYYPEQLNGFMQPRTEAFRIPEGTQLFGGFAGWESQIDERVLVDRSS